MALSQSALSARDAPKRRLNWPHRPSLPEPQHPLLDNRRSRTNNTAAEPPAANLMRDPG
jgi:hypothetical protein